MANKQFWGDVKYLGVCILPVAWVAFTLQFTGRGHRLTLALLALLSIEPTLVLVLLANPATDHLVHTYPTAFEQFPVVRFGPVGGLNLLYTQVVLPITGGFFVVTVWWIPDRHQSRGVSLVMARPCSAKTLYHFNVRPLG